MMEATSMVGLFIINGWGEVHMGYRAIDLGGREVRNEGLWVPQTQTEWRGSFGGGGVSEGHQLAHNTVHTNLSHAHTHTRQPGTAQREDSSAFRRRRGKRYSASSAWLPQCGLYTRFDSHAAIDLLQ